MEKQIKLTLTQARNLYILNPEYRDTLLSVFTDKELGIKSGYPKSWNDIKKIDGFYITEDSSIYSAKNVNILYINNNIFATQKQAKSALAFAQLSQLAKEMNGDWTPDWSTSNTKYSINRNSLALYINSWSATFHLIVFKTKEMAEFSLKHHEQLWKDYYELD